MKIHLLQAPPAPALSEALHRFEAQFSYPLGPGQRFRISHGDDYSRFFRAIAPGRAGSFVAVDQRGEIRGTLGVAIRHLQLPGGECRTAAYLGDLKIAEGPGRGYTLMRLGAAATSWCLSQGATCAYGVVMQGTARLPSAYTGKLGLHPFRACGEIALFRLPVNQSVGSAEDPLIVSMPELDARHRTLSANAIAPLGGTPEARSVSTPEGLVAPDGSACGILEDTRRAKRLLLEDGAEMMVAHLSKFAYGDPPTGAKLLRQALRRCSQRQLAPALFAAVPAADRDAFRDLLGESTGIVEASATVYATELETAGAPWNISTSEI